MGKTGYIVFGRFTLINSLELVVEAEVEGFFLDIAAAIAQVQKWHSPIQS
jgi:hypothetical protein